MHIPDLAIYREKLTQVLTPERLQHSEGVMYTAAGMAMCYNIDIRQAMIAGLFHDCGKFGSLEEQYQQCRKLGIALSPSEQENFGLVHTKLGVYLAKHQYGINDAAILSAIRYHTTGRPAMSELEKIIYIADMIEPWRKDYPQLTKIRRLAFVDLDKAVAYASEETIKYIRARNLVVDPITIATCEYYKTI